MHDTHNRFLHNEQRRHEMALNSWADQVSTCRDLAMALKLARHMPPSGRYLAGMRHLTNEASRRAERRVDDALSRRLRQADPAQHSDLLPLAKGMPQYRNITSWAAEVTRKALSKRSIQAG